MRLGLTNILDLLVLAGEAAWLVAWSVVVGAWIGPTRTPLLDLSGVLFLLAFSAFLARFASGSQGRTRRVMSALILFLGILVAVAPAVVALQIPAGLAEDLSAWNSRLDGDAWGRALLTGVAAALVWRRGLDMGGDHPDLLVVEATFRTGVIAMSSLLAFVGLAGSAAPLASDVLIPSTLVVLLAGLISMPLARIVEVGTRPRHAHGPGLALGGPWLAMLLTIVAGILAFTMLLAWLFTFERIGAVLEVIGRASDGVVSALIYLLAIPFELLIQVLVFLARFFLPSRADRQRPQQPETDWLSRLGEQGRVGEISPETMLALKVALGVVLAAVLVWVLWRAISRLGRQWRDDEVEESRDSVWSWPGWSSVWKWLVGWVRPVSTRAGAMVASIRRERLHEERSPRGLYREMLRLGARLGYPRLPYETPIEYEQRLGETIHEGEADIRTLSAAYIRFRYAPPSDDKPDISALSSALARLRSTPVVIHLSENRPTVGQDESS